MNFFIIRIDFYESLRKNAIWIVDHFFLHKKVPVLMNHKIWKKSYVMIYYYRYLFVKKKVFNYSELHFSEVTSYKLHTLKFHVTTHTHPVNLLPLFLFLKHGSVCEKKVQNMGSKKRGSLLFKKRRGQAARILIEILKKLHKNSVVI